MKIDFNGKTVLVTGGSRGIGREIVVQLLLSNARVIALDKLSSDLQELKNEYPSVEIVCVDLSNWEQTKEVVEGLGDIDCLVNNAGIVYLESIGDVTENMIDLHVNINLKAPINLIQIVSNGLKRRGCGGSIVNLSSMAARKALNGHLAYASAKAALDMCTKVSALELGAHNIRVNSINPTVTLTAMAKQVWSEPEKRDNMLKNIPMNRFVNPSEVANAVIYLLSDKSSMITGTILPVDGGLNVT